MAELNKDAAELMLEYSAHACTDVTGFSLMGHLALMARHSGAGAEIDMADVPVFAEALACTRAGIIPGAVERNLESFGEDTDPNPDTGESLFALLFDAQTSGGLLVALPPEKADAYVNALQSRGHTAAARIGRIVEKNERRVRVNLAEPKRLIGTYREPIEARTEKTLSLTPALFECCVGEHESTGARMDKTPASVSRAENSPPLAPGSVAGGVGDAFKAFSQAANAPGGIDARNKKLMAIALSIATKCEPCLKMHLQNALSQGMKWEEIEEAAWMAVFFCGAPAKMFYEKLKQEIQAE